MKLDFLDDLSDGGKFPDADPNQLIRLYDFNSREALLFAQFIRKDLLGEEKTIELQSVSFIESINCSLTMKLCTKDMGIISMNNAHFTCMLTKETYTEMLLLIEPFYEADMSGYQWLYDLDIPIDFLFSSGSAGSW